MRGGRGTGGDSGWCILCCTVSGVLRGYLECVYLFVLRGSKRLGTPSPLCKDLYGNIW